MVAIARIHPAIVLIGDSLTQLSFGESTANPDGWASRLAAAYQRRADVYSRGYRGYNTRHCIQQVLPGLFSQEEGSSDRVMFYTLWLGANDMAMPGYPQHVPIEEYGRNLEFIVNFLKEKGPRSVTSSDSSPPVILMTPPPIDDLAFNDDQEHGVYDRTNTVSRAYGGVTKQVSERLGCSCLDVWELLDGHSLDEYSKHQTDDGIHLAMSGNARVFEGLLELIEKDHPHLMPLPDGEDPSTSIGIPLHGKNWDEL